MTKVPAKAAGKKKEQRMLVRVSNSSLSQLEVDLRVGYCSSALFWNELDGGVTTMTVDMVLNYGRREGYDCD